MPETKCVFAGQGLNMTMEDAAELAWHVQQYGLTTSALERFEAKRLPRVKTILDHAKVTAVLQIQDG